MHRILGRITALRFSFLLVFWDWGMFTGQKHSLAICHALSIWLVGSPLKQKSRSTTICFEIGVGAGQQSRVDCVKLAGRKLSTWHLRFHPKVNIHSLLRQGELLEPVFSIVLVLPLQKLPPAYKGKAYAVLLCSCRYGLHSTDSSSLFCGHFHQKKRETPDSNSKGNVLYCIAKTV